MAWTTPGTATAGEVLTAAFWNTQVRDNMVDIDSRLDSIEGTWTAFTPGTNINVGSTGTKYGRYKLIGKVMFVTVVMTLGGTGISVPSDATLSPTTNLPVAPNDTANGWNNHGNATYIDASTLTHYNGWWKGVYLGYQGVYGYVAATVPFTWATGDVIVAHAFWETV